MFRTGMDDFSYSQIHHKTSGSNIKSAHPLAALLTFESDAELADGEEETDDEADDLFLEVEYFGNFDFQTFTSNHLCVSDSFEEILPKGVNQPIYLIYRNFRL
jgi:hypothetical protein